MTCLKPRGQTVANRVGTHSPGAKEEKRDEGRQASSSGSQETRLELPWGLMVARLQAHFPEPQLVSQGWQGGTVCTQMGQNFCAHQRDFPPLHVY